MLFSPSVDWAFHPSIHPSIHPSDHSSILHIFLINAPTKGPEKSSTSLPLHTHTRLSFSCMFYSILMTVFWEFIITNHLPYHPTVSRCLCFLPASFVFHLGFICRGLSARLNTCQVKHRCGLRPSATLDLRVENPVYIACVLPTYICSVCPFLKTFFFKCGFAYL